MKPLQTMHRPILQPCCPHVALVPTRTATSTTAHLFISRPRARICACHGETADGSRATYHHHQLAATGQSWDAQQTAAAGGMSSDSAAFSCALQQQHQNYQQQQQHRQQQSSSWFRYFAIHLPIQRLGGAVLAAALLALVMPGKRSTAVAATLPPPGIHLQSSISSSSGRDVTRQHASVDSWSSSSSSAMIPSSRAVDVYHPASSSTRYNSSDTLAPGGLSIINSNSSNADSLYNNTSSVGATASGSSTTAVTAAAAADLSDLLAHERATVNLFAAVRPSVVNISHLRAMQNFYTLDIHRMAVGQGSGFIWDQNGHVITNYHIIKGAAEVKVTLFDHSSCTARVVGYDSAKDIAVLKLALPRGRLEALKPVTSGSSDGLRVGQSVFAIGNPFGLDHTLTQGIVSGLGREVSAGLSAIKGVIQSDAAINPGNSGGVLLNSQGAVIGVNLGILDPSGKGSFSGVGFAIPIDTVRGLVEQILQHGRVRRPSLGITIAPEQVLAQLGTEGVLVLEVPAGTPAAAAGLRPTYRDVFGDIVLGDIIVGMDTRPIRSTAELVAALDERRAGDKVRCDVLRDGKRLSMTVTLGERGTYCE